MTDPNRERPALDDPALSLYGIQHPTHNLSIPRDGEGGMPVLTDAAEPTEIKYAPGRVLAPSPWQRGEGDYQDLGLTVVRPGQEGRMPAYDGCGFWWFTSPDGQTTQRLVGVLELSHISGGITRSGILPSDGMGQPQTH